MIYTRASTSNNTSRMVQCSLEYTDFPHVRFWILHWSWCSFITSINALTTKLINTCITLHTGLN